MGTYADEFKAAIPDEDEMAEIAALHCSTTTLEQQDVTGRLRGVWTFTDGSEAVVFVPDQDDGWVRVLYHRIHKRIVDLQSQALKDMSSTCINRFLPPAFSILPSFQGGF